MGAAILANIMGFPPEMDEQSAAYIQHWIKALQNDKTMVIKAASKAKAAVQYIL